MKGNSIFDSIAFRLMKLPRVVHCRVKRHGLKNKTPTIICNNCVGGVIYHDMGLAFLSPTINLFFSNDDFPFFVEHLQEALSADMKEDVDTGVAYPVGLIVVKNHPIRLHFLHYKSFKEAQTKWNQRKQRISFNNLYVIWACSNATEKIFRDFEKIPFERKVLITNKNPENKTNVVVHSLYARQNSQTPNILNFRHRFSLRRDLEEFDYVTFLNQGADISKCERGHPQQRHMTARPL